MDRCFVLFLILFHVFDGNLAVRNDDDRAATWSLTVAGNKSDDRTLTVSHRGIVHHDNGSHGVRQGNSTKATSETRLHVERGVSTVTTSASQTALGGLLELLHRGSHVKVAAAPDVTLKFHDILIFYGIVYTLGCLTWLGFRYLEPVKVNFSKALRQVAMTYWRWSRLAPIIACSALYVLADMLAVEVGSHDDKGEWCWKFALLAATAIYNSVCQRRFYLWLDGLVEEGEGWRHKVKQVAMMQGAHLFIYLPLGVPFFIILADFFNRTASDTLTNCSTSALAGIPRHLVDSTAMAAEQLPLSFSSSLMFWPASNLINFVLIQTWSPGFKSTWDAIMTVLWNAYLVAKSESGSPVAVGPILANRDVVTPDLQKQESSLDCKRFSLSAIFWFITDVLVWIANTTYKICAWILRTLRWAWHKWCVFCVDTYHMIKTFLYLTGCYTKRKTWESWCVGCYIVRWLYIITWTLVSYVCSIIYRLITIPFKMFDSVKWYIGFFWVPRLWNYDQNICPQANFSQNWTQAGVIWDGEIFGNMDMGKS